MSARRPLELLADVQAERPALWAGGRWHSYGELRIRATRLAARLQQMGIRSGDRVGILALNHPAHIDLLLAAPLLGFIFTPFNHRLSAPEHRRLVADMRPRICLTDAAHAGLHADASPQLGLADYEAWLSGAPALEPAEVPDENSIHMILFTGGSTGLPKGACIPYRQTLANCANTAAGWDLRDSDCAIQATPCFHAALNVFTTPLLHLGGRVVLMPQFEPGEYLALAQTHAASLLFMVPTMYQMLAEHPQFARSTLTSVRWAISGGAPCPPPVRAAFAARGIRFRQGYGMTEAGVNCFMITAEEADAHPDSVGRPLVNTEASLLSATGRACGSNEIGELRLRGPHICAGYFEKPAEWSQVFRDGWLHTGDLAQCDDQGLYRIVGRAKEMFISGGENVYPTEVERELSQCAGVAECAVLGIPHPKWGEVGLAAVVLKPGATADADSLRAALKSRLAGYKVPREFLFLPALPRTGAGKIAKPELRKLHQNNEETRG